MRRATRRALLGTIGLAAVAGPALPVTPGDLTCIAPQDTAAIDRQLRAVASPLAGEGDELVRSAAGIGLDPRLLIAIAAHETQLESYPPSQRIHNPFGLGPGWRFAHERDAIRQAALSLSRGYLTQGRVTIALISPKWAPLGAANDPLGLNRSWTRAVSAYYRALGGDPERPVFLTVQSPVSRCGAGVTFGRTGKAVAWSGRPPRVTGRSLADGSDPLLGRPATISGFVFPLAAPAGARVAYGNDFGARATAAGCPSRRRRCAITLRSAPWTLVVAATTGSLVSATPAERVAGVAFWLQSANGDRVGYSGLASYMPGIGERVAVRAGAPLGTTTGRLSVAWERRGARVNPYPLLVATRPSG